MRIAVLTTGRFHVCDLARELAARGHEVVFYSVVLPRRTWHVGLPSQGNRWLGPYVGPPYVLTRLALRTCCAPGLLPFMSVVVDRVAARLVEPCYRCIGMSQMSLRTIETVRRRMTWDAYGQRDNAVIGELDSGARRTGAVVALLVSPPPAVARTAGG
jgi:hypothetical protein